MKRTFALVLLALAMSCAETITDPQTQLTLRLYASPETMGMMSQVRVSVFGPNGRVSPNGTMMTNIATIKSWPIDVQVTPMLGNDSSEQIEVVAQALSASGAVLVEQRALSSFVPREKHLLSLWLLRCGTLEYGKTCEQTLNCHGPSCQTCVDNRCANTPDTPGALLPLLDAEEVPLVDAAQPWPTPVVVMDASVDSGEAGMNAPTTDGGGPGEVCWNDFAWVAATAQGPIPAGARVLIDSLTAQDDDGNLAPRAQYMCRVKQPDSSYIHGKVNGKPDGQFDYGCYYVAFDRVTGQWVAHGADAAGDTFDVYAPPATCVTEWVPAGSNKALPTKAFGITNDPQGRLAYACRMMVNDPMSVGWHIGRVGSSIGDICRIQFWGKERDSTVFDVLVQDAP